MKNFHSKLKQAGISLLEVLLSLAIIAVILIMATRYFFIATTNNNINFTKRQVASIIAALANFRSQNATYTPNEGGTLSIHYLVEHGFLTKSSSYNGQKLIDPWGNSFSVKATGTNSNTAIISLQMPSSDTNKYICNAIKQTFSQYPSANCTGTAFCVSVGTDQSLCTPS